MRNKIPPTHSKGIHHIIDAGFDGLNPVLPKRFDTMDPNTVSLDLGGQKLVETGSSDTGAGVSIGSIEVPSGIVESLSVYSLPFVLDAGTDNCVFMVWSVFLDKSVDIIYNDDNCSTTKFI